MKRIVLKIELLCYSSTCTEWRGQLWFDLSPSSGGVRRNPCRFELFSEEVFFSVIFIRKFSLRKKISRFDFFHVWIEMRDQMLIIFHHPPSCKITQSWAWNARKQMLPTLLSVSVAANHSKTISWNVYLLTTDCCSWRNDVNVLSALPANLETWFSELGVVTSVIACSIIVNRLKQMCHHFEEEMSIGTAHSCAVLAGSSPFPSPYRLSGCTEIHRC